MVMGAIENLA